MIAAILRHDGKREPLHIANGNEAIFIIAYQIGAAVVEQINLNDGLVMLVNGDASESAPVNDIATKLYETVCLHEDVCEIHGDVVLVRDKDFGGLSWQTRQVQD